MSYLRTVSLGTPRVTTLERSVSDSFPVRPSVLSRIRCVFLVVPSNTSPSLHSLLLSTLPFQHPHPHQSLTYLVTSGINPET